MNNTDSEEYNTTIASNNYDLTIYDLTFKENGEIYHKDRLLTTEMQIVDSLRKVLLGGKI